MLGQDPVELGLRGGVAGVLEGLALEAVGLGPGAYVEQDRAGPLGRPDGEGVVVEAWWDRSWRQPIDAASALDHLRGLARADHRGRDAAAEVVHLAEHGDRLQLRARTDLAGAAS